MVTILPSENDLVAFPLEGDYGIGIFNDFVGMDRVSVFFGDSVRTVDPRKSVLIQKETVTKEFKKFIGTKVVRGQLEKLLIEYGTPNSISTGLIE